MAQRSPSRTARTTKLRGLPLAALTLVVLMVLASRAAACPACDGGPAGVNEVRAAIFDDHFWTRAAAALAPFPVLAGVVALIYFGPPTLRRTRGPGGTRPPAG